MASTSKTKKRTAAKPAAKKTTTEKRSRRSNSSDIRSTGDALKNAALIISLLVNLYVLSLWVTLQLTSYYDDTLVKFFIHR